MDEGTLELSKPFWCFGAFASKKSVRVMEAALADDLKTQKNGDVKGPKRRNG